MRRREKSAMAAVCHRIIEKAVMSLSLCQRWRNARDQPILQASAETAWRAANRRHVSTFAAARVARGGVTSYLGENVGGTAGRHLSRAA